ncbi:MAG: hypothetical protein JWR21_3048 [Herminiimonas sp.]|nr:hypothetical protein [Herminiimonas sp.]MDB5855748.1 hypothetical protein [Herminiimonas sp.]
MTEIALSPRRQFLRAAGRLLVCFAVGLALCVGPASRWANAAAMESDPGLLERSVKAAYLYKFLSYVEWPPAALNQPGSPFVIGIAGADAVASELMTLANGRTVDNRPVMVKPLNFGESFAGVHILFIGQQEAPRQKQWLVQAARRPVLTVTESNGGLQDGSCINFRQVEGRIRFEISLAAAEGNALKLSSRLLSVALDVKQANP